MASDLAPTLAMLDVLDLVGEGRAEASRAAIALESAPDDAPVSLVAGGLHVDLRAVSAGLRHVLEHILREAGQGRTVVISTTPDEEIASGAAADILGISRQHVLNLIRRGVLPARRVHDGARSHHRLRLSDVVVHLRRRQAGAVALAAIEQLSDELDLDGLDRDVPPSASPAVVSGRQD